MLTYRLWQAALEAKAMYKLAKAQSGTVVHALAIKLSTKSGEEQGQEPKGPVCQYKQRGSAAKSLFAGGITKTSSYGVSAADEAVTWTLAVGHLTLCKDCAKSMSPGMIVALENGGIM